MTSEESNAADATFTWTPLHWNVWSIVAAVSSIIGIVGNLLVIAVIHKRRSKNRPTDILINALAVADFLTSLLMIPTPLAATMPSRGPWGWLYCRLIFGSYFTWVCVTASIYTLLAISVERYIAIVHPIYFYSAVTKRRVIRVVVVAWIIGLVIPIPSRVVFVVDAATHGCVITYDYRWLVRFIPVFLSTTRIFVPVAVMIVTQLAIVRVLRQQSQRFKTSTSLNLGPSFHRVAKTRLTKVMLVVIGIFIVLWTPMYVYLLLVGFQITPSTDVVTTTVYDAFLVLGYYNSCVNPIIYTLRSTKFRSAVKDIFRPATSRKADTSDLF